ncbi:MAG TPA: SDR family oxidoreductase [Chloroflexi bacterium]|jgi:NAD(P)-dependent dehydrogenase (short-subunit alcohol dehydrogenase family)|nr:SDR family oxidoreductase [Chloroflexota bacterium]
MDSEYLNRTFNVTGRVVVLTGGGGILCGTMARELARAGASVAVCDIVPEAAQRVVDDIAAEGGDALAVCTDVLSKPSLEAAAAQVLERFGRVDVLINGAGGNRKQATTAPDLSFFDLPEDAFQWVFNLNFIGTLLPTQVFCRQMVAQGEGCVINICSINAFSPLTKIPAYSAAKAAVRNFTEWLAVHMSQEYSTRIRVNAIAPGFFLTNQNRYLLIDEATGEATPRGQTIMAHTPMGRYGDPKELMSTVLWLMSPASSFVHGVTVPVDGGFSICSGV